MIREKRVFEQFSLKREPTRLCEMGLDAMNQNDDDRNAAAAPRPDDFDALVRPIPKYSWLTHCTAILLFIMTFLLVSVGGNVTSLDQGLAVPDGWTTFGYWTPIAPLSVWWDNMGSRWEHGHRLFGNIVGLLSIAMVILCFWKQSERRWLKWASVTFLIMVIIQGAMGVYRVTELSIGLALIHGVFGQIILGLCVFMVAATGKVWIDFVKRRKTNRELGLKGLRMMGVIMILLLLMQLLLGAGVRHSKSALAIPDFPKMYGQWVPPLSQDAITVKTTEFMVRDYTSGQVAIHIAHRLLAFGILIYGIVFFFKLLRKAREWSVLLGPAFTMINLLVLQVILGVLVIWSGDYPANATVHQATGAALLAACVWVLIRIYLVSGIDVVKRTKFVEDDKPQANEGGIEGGVA
ncbi:COX15/CtaA family protein [Planctomycetota bacterium]|nr:COX15/CtaA family protein [Planctomycetota bacterium]